MHSRDSKVTSYKVRLSGNLAELHGHVHVHGDMDMDMVSCVRRSAEVRLVWRVETRAESQGDTGLPTAGPADLGNSSKKTQYVPHSAVAWTTLRHAWRRIECVQQRSNSKGSSVPVVHRAPQALHLKDKMQTAGYKAKVEKWDSDSDETDEEDLMV